MTTEQEQLLDFRVLKRPILIQGVRENRLYPERQALIHSKTGKPFDVCSTQYHPHQPREVVKDIEQAINGIAHITNLDVLRGGETVMLSCQFNQDIQALHQNETNGEANDEVDRFLATGQDLDYAARKQARKDAGYRVGQALNRGNLYRSGFKISIGNTVGNPCKVIGEVVEIVCLNGLLRTGARSFLIVNHRNRSLSVAEKIIAAIPELQQETHQILQLRDQLTSTPADTKVMRTYLLELTDKELFSQVLDKTIADRGQYPPDVQRNLFLDAVTSHDQVAWYLLDRIEAEGNRLCKRMNNHLTDQPLAAGTQGTLWQPYMAATYTIDHQSTAKGEYASDNRKLSSAFGEGAKVKLEALELATQYQQILAARN